MRCSICGATATGDLCSGCEARRVRLRAASRETVDEAAKKTLRLAEGVDGKKGEPLIEYVISGRAAGRLW